MVQIISGWKCPYCGTVFTDREKAENCAKDCVEVDDPILHNMSVCEMCNFKYKYEEDAIECEEKHLALNDKYYREYEVKKNFEALSKAASIPGQMKLGGE